MEAELGPKGKVRTVRCPPGPLTTTIPDILVHQGPFPEDLGNRIKKFVPGPKSKEADQTINRKRALRGPVGLSNIRSKDYEVLGTHRKVILTRTYDGSFSNWAT